MRKLFIVSMLILFYSSVFHDFAYSKRNEIQLHFLDVGQADAILLETSTGKTMLIDAGDQHHEQQMMEYLLKLGITKIDVLLATHPHHDHIGGMDKIIETFYVDKFYMTSISYHTKHYENLLTALKSEQIPVKRIERGMSISLEHYLDIKVLGPFKKEYEDLNNQSVIIKIKHGKNRFLLMGDAGIEAEEDLIKHKGELKTDVLKVGHHGADTATSDAFLEKIKPDYAVISVGRKNRYDFPDKSVLKRLKDHNIAVYRTDQLGTIIVGSNGKSLSFITKISQHHDNEVNEKRKNNF
ncbi:ComEC/Rec2 family competence protein [Bacillus taeanensis]|uniref:MBL fold metallo-hydrolase n=1 Tax=Bacillus taeanensis TaxID=273032 RepID=A0A366XYZ6_9BACI|nr:ComEC/Rec2 family competence protein [Bacillus taeanensis]RBW69373.1 MBL fold metallo-hydrolase [Bacillus taeanensis]